MRDNIAVFTKYEDRYILIAVTGGRAEQIYVYGSLDQIDIGTVVNCRAENSVPGIGSCFVRYSADDIAFVGKVYKPGTLVPLMYKKEAYRDKKACFTDRITIDGDYTVVTKGDTFVKASSKIPDDAKKKLCDLFYDKAAVHNVGVIIRTKAFTDPDGAGKATVEFDHIISLIDNIIKTSEHEVQYSVLYRPLPAYIKDILRLREEGITEVVTDRKEIMDRLEDHYDRFTGPVNLSDRVSLRFYEDDLLPLCKLYAFDAKISEALSRKVYLKSGAYITIDTTEALTAVDVNSAQSEKGGEKEETFLSINLEAADEIARQLRLRNISGMIVVDFINMSNPDSYTELEDRIRQAISVDHVNTRFIDFTGMKLCEIVRQRLGRTLYHNLKG